MLYFQLSHILLTFTSTAFASPYTNPVTQPASIKFEANYQLLPACINQCLWDIGDDDSGPLGGNLGVHIGCVPPWLNGCYCRPQSAYVAHAFISSCASYLCGTVAANDVASGTSVYASYCSRVMGAAYTPDTVTRDTGVYFAFSFPS
ncbi:hypothetical protein K469DRAFT_143498 [Zopfia rhizophila CBS 207.26]|uniref:Extracellular membrane protein CFEM domain-containing protein n=1 Tax=Zopfia rhizophila CBS 207.26 TaxID=1314779 RepID=A0A6A6E7D9_9PEZI|nr:hypothetical protein K469DRAFT_143498 [Zopfia rhizophila CBS 207.26]